MKIYTGIPVIILMSFVAHAQNNNHVGLFPTIDHSGSITDKLHYSFYYFTAFNLINDVADNKNEEPNFFVFYSEQALSYNLNKNLSFTGSYVYERQNPIDTDYRNEHRFYAQTTYKHYLNKTALKHRLRYDGRFIQNRITGETPFTNRVRYLIGLTKPLYKKERYYFNAYNEFFFNTFKKTPVIYAEDWAYAGIGYKTAKAGSFEPGLLYIFWVNNQQFDLTNFFYLQLTWTTQLNLRKQNKQ